MARTVGSLAAAEAGFRSRLLSRRPLDLEALAPLLQEHLPQLAALAEVPAARGEGHPGESALQHTQRVLQAVQPHLESLPGEQAQVLYLAALLHEIGRGRAIGPLAESAGHERSGAARAREALFHLQVPPALRDQVVYLVRSHTLPLTFGKRRIGAPRLLRLAWTLNTGLLHRLALAECTASRSDRACEPVAAFAERCRSLGILGREPPPLLAPEAWSRLAPRDPHLKRRLAGEMRFRRLKGTLNTPEEAEVWLRSQHPERAGTLYLPVGVPGSGKSTWVQRNLLPHARLISMDIMREQLLGTRADQSRNREVYTRCRQALRNALRAGETVVWDAQSHTWNARQGLLKLAREAHAYVVTVYVDVPLSVALERNRQRSVLVPEEVILRSYRDMEEPCPFEAEESWRVDIRGQCTRRVWDESLAP